LLGNEADSDDFEEWFLVPLPVIDEVCDGSINGFAYDPTIARLTAVPTGAMQ
jgi:hypothetical protein